METIKEFIEARYWPHFQGDLTPKWRKRSEDFLRVICDGLGGKGFDEVSTEVVDKWLATVRRRYNTPFTPNKIITRVKHVWRIAIRWGAATRNPFIDVKRKREPEKKFQALSELEQNLLLTHCGPNLRAYQVGARYTGARVSSLWKLQERDVNLSKNTITFRKTKNGEDYTIPLHSLLKAYLLEHHLLAGGDPLRYVFHHYADPGHVSRMFYRVKKKQGVAFRFHDYRHSVGSKLGSKYKSNAIVQRMLGHKDPRMSLRYTHIDDGALSQAAEDSL